MALAINTPYKTNTVASVSGTTFTSNGTPFVAGDVGRFLVFTNGNAIGQIRRIAGYTSSTVVTVDLAWNTSNIAEFSDSLPTAGDTWEMSLPFADIADGTHIIQDSAYSYRQIPAAGTITVSVFVADVEKNLVLYPQKFVLSGTGAIGRMQLGQMHPNGYAIRGCSLIDLDTSTNGWSVSGGAGDLHLYGCNITNISAGVFWRLYRGSGQIARFVDCDFSGGYSGRLQGTRSCKIRCTFRAGPAGGIGIATISPMGLVKDCKFQGTALGPYAFFTLGAGDVTSPRFDALTGNAAKVTGAVTSLTWPIIDYIESEVSSLSVPVNFDSTNAASFVSFRQWVTTGIVNLSLAAITDSARRVVRNGAGTVVDNATTTSGSFAKITVEVKSFPAVTGNRTWAQGVAIGPYDEAVATYLYTPTVLSLPLATSSNNTYPLASDAYVTQTTKATVDAYTLISSADRLYDRYKSWFVDNLDTVWPTFGVQRLNGSGDTLLLGSTALTIDATAGAVFTPNAGANTLVIKATAYAADSKFAYIRSTSGSITLANAATLSCGVDLDGANLIAQDIDAVTGAITTTGTCRIDVAAPGVYPTAAINAASKIRVTAATSGDVHDCTAVVFASGSTFENNSGQPITVMLASGATQPTKLETSGTITYSQPTVDLTVTSTESGTLLQVFTTGTQTVLASTTGTTLTFTHSNNTVDIVAQKAGFLPQRVTGIVLSGDVTQGFTLAADYNYDSAHGLTYTTDASWASNQLTVPTFGPSVRGVYSLMIDAFIAETALRNTAFNLSMNGPTSLFLIEGAEGATDVSITNMTGGGVRYISASGATTAEFSGVLSSGVVAGSQPEYELGSGGTIADARATGDVNEIIKGYGDATHGNFDRRAHLQFKVQRNGYRQAEFDVVESYGLTTIEPTLYILSLPMLAIDGLTLGDPGITGVTITDDSAAPVSWDAGDGAKDYSITITDAGANSGANILRWLNYFLSLDATFQGKEPFYWPEMVIDNGAAFETLRGILHNNPDSVAGVRVIRAGDIPHPDFTRFQADDGTYGTPPIVATGQVSGIVAGSRLQIYNVTTASEIYNDVIAGTAYSYSYNDTVGISAGDSVRVRLTKIDHDEFAATVIAAASGWGAIAAQESNAVYVANGIDGSTVTKFAADYVEDQIDLQVASDFTAAEMYAWWCYNLTTDEGIRQFFGGITAVDQANYRVNTATVSVLFDNLTASNKKQSDSARIFRDDDAYPVYDPTTGGGGIDLNWRVPVYLVSTGGSALTVAENAKLMGLDTTGIPAIKVKTDALAFTVSGQVDANVQSMNNAEVLGNGTSGDKWRGGV